MSVKQLCRVQLLRARLIVNWLQRELACLGSRSLWRLVKPMLLFLGGVIFTICFSIYQGTNWSETDSMDRAFKTIDAANLHPSYLSRFLESTLPIQCHSHNDYWRRHPLWSALATGCISVEADIWPGENLDVLVGHSSHALSKDKTLYLTYIDPLVEILNYRYSTLASGKQSVRSKARTETPGVFLQDPMQSLTLLLDLKVPSEAIWPALNQALEPLRARHWLTHWNGEVRVERPITVVVSGEASFDMVVANSTYRDIFFDAPLDALASPEDHQTTTDAKGQAHGSKAYKYNVSNSHYASSSMKRALGHLWQREFSQTQLDLMRTQLQQAKDRGLVSRYWGTPQWPRKHRDSVWGVLMNEGIGILNVDDLRAARKGNWGTW